MGCTPYSRCACKHSVTEVLGIAVISEVNLQTNLFRRHLHFYIGYMHCKVLNKLVSVNEYNKKEVRLIYVILQTNFFLDQTQKNMPVSKENFALTS